MGLYERLLNNNPAGTFEKVPVHQFMAALGEIERGRITEAQLAAALGLDVTEQAELATLVKRIVTPLEAVALGGLVTLENVGIAYDTTMASQGLGMVGLQTAGVTGFEFAVRVNKVGTGVQSWQLWNETDGQEIAVINDSGATGIKVLSTARALGPLPSAIKLIRIRAKSTVASDDPVFLGASLLIRRAERLTNTELHDVLLLSEGGYAYATPAALKARLDI